MEDGFSFSPADEYHGVRKRKWGKWVSEIREPGKKTRIWLGSFDSAEMAAAAHDVAALRLKGGNAHLNFPESVDQLPRPVSSRPKDIRSAAVEAALRVRMKPEIVKKGKMPALTAAVERLAEGWAGFEEMGLDSPKMWAELAEALLMAPPRMVAADMSADQMEEVLEQGSLWDPYL